MSGESEFEKLTSDYLEGSLEEEALHRLEAQVDNEESASRFVDQLQTHHGLTALARRDADSDLSSRVVRELRLESDAERFSHEVVGRLKRDRRSMVRAGGAVAAGIALFFAVVLFILRDEAPGTAAAPRGRALLVVDAFPASRGDTRIAEELRTMGFAVDERRFAELAPGDVEGKALIAVSSSSTVRRSQEAGITTLDLLRSARTPLLTWEPMLFAALGMTRGEVHKTDWATERFQTHIAIRNAAHPLAAGLSGDVRVYRRPMQASWGRPAGDVAIVAALAERPEAAVLFAYDRGAEMGRGRAPARRVGFFSFNEGATVHTDDAWTLFGAAVKWCVEESGR